jgi:O-Antigen ligase
MLNVASVFIGSADVDRPSDRSFTERVVFWVTVLAPVWWLAGIQPLLYPLLVLFLFLKNFSFDKLSRIAVPISVWSWLLMSFVMAWTAGLGLADMGFPIQPIGAAIVTFLKSYFMIFAGMILPFWCQMRLHVITRAVSWLAAGFLVAIPVQILMLYSGINRALRLDEGIIPPLAQAIPGSQSLKVVFANIEPFFGINMPRTVLYTADPPILGTCSILMFIICLGETNPRLRRLALAGSLLGLLISFSRLSWLCFPLALLIVIIFRSHFAREKSLLAASALSFVCGLIGVTLIDLVKNSMDTFTSARAVSSADRALVISKTIEAWQRSPWLGWGVIRDSVKWHIYDVALGSFSSYPAVLYLHGIVGMVFFVMALSLTFAQYWQDALRGNALCQRAIASLVVLYILFNGTPLTWMSVYFWFYFFWLGGIIVETQSRSLSVWEQLTD